MSDKRMDARHRVGDALLELSDALEAALPLFIPGLKERMENRVALLRGEATIFGCSSQEKNARVYPEK